MEDWKWCLTIRICLSKTNMASGDKRGLKLWKTKLKRGMGRFPFTKKFRKFRLGCKWNMIFRFVPLENCRKKRNSWKGSPVFPVETSQWKFVFHLKISRLYHQFHAFRRISSGQASLVFQQKWRLIRVSFLEAFCKQTFRVTTSALPATL